MLEIVAIADPKSNVKDALVIFESHFFTMALPLNAGIRSTISIPTPPGAVGVDFLLGVISRERRATVLADGIWRSSQILLFGINPQQFIGIIQDLIVSPRPLGVGPTCQLRCHAGDTPVAGPGCLPCNEDGLILQVCC